MLVFGVHLWSEKREWPHVIVFKMYLSCQQMPDDSFTRRMKHLLRFGQ